MSSPSIGQYFTLLRWPFGRDYELKGGMVDQTARSAITGRFETTKVGQIGFQVDVWNQMIVDDFWKKVLTIILIAAVTAGLITGGYYMYPYLNNKE
jgi:hypothetical protein